MTRRCRGCSQVFPGSRDTMIVAGQLEHIACYDAEWDEPVTFAPIDDVLEDLMSIPEVAAQDRCDPQTGHHSMPHRGCLMR